MTEPITIGIFTTDFYPHLGGMGRVVYDTFQRLRAAPDLRLLVFSPAQNDIPGHHTMFPFTRRWGKHFAQSLLLNLSINRWIRHFQISLVHLHGGVAGQQLFISLPVPVLYTVHHTYAQQSRLVPGYGWKRALAKLEPLSYQKADAITAVSHATRRALVNQYHLPEAKVQVIPNGVDVARFHSQPGIAKESGNLLFIGRLDRRKGVEVALAAMPRILRQLPQAHLYIGGTGPHGKALQKLAHSLGLETSVTFLGFIPDAELATWYNRAEVLLAPSLFEGFGLSAVEAMACGTPVVATRVDGLEETIVDGETGFLVERGDVAALAERALQILDDPGLRDRLGRQAVDWVREKFAFDQTAERYRELYETLAKG